MSLKTTLCAASALALCAATGAFADSHAATVTIATVNNGDMIRMQHPPPSVRSGIRF